MYCIKSLTENIDIINETFFRRKSLSEIISSKYRRVSTTTKHALKISKTKRGKRKSKTKSGISDIRIDPSNPKSMKTSS